MSYHGSSKGSFGNIRRLQRFHARRSDRAKHVDEGLRAPLAKTPEQWLSHPNRFDTPEVDTPKKSEESSRQSVDIPQKVPSNQQRETMLELCGTYN